MTGHFLDWLVPTKAKSNTQHAVHNRATIRVADRTDVSGRATADEVSLDRIHNCIREVCAFVAATDSLLLALDVASYYPDRSSGAVGGCKRAGHATAHTKTDVVRYRGGSE